MAANLRLRGQEVQIKVTQGGAVVNEVSLNIGSFNDDVAFVIKEDGFLGEKQNRYDQSIDGYSGDLEFQVNEAKWLNFVLSVERKARREDPTLVFNIIRTDLFSNGSSAVIVYSDVSWGPFPTSIGARADFVKVKTTFKTSDRSVNINAI